MKKVYFIKGSIKLFDYADMLQSYRIRHAKKAIIQSSKGQTISYSRINKYQPLIELINQARHDDIKLLDAGQLIALSAIKKMIVGKPSKKDSEQKAGDISVTTHNSMYELQSFIRQRIDIGEDIINDIAISLYQSFMDELDIDTTIREAYRTAHRFLYQIKKHKGITRKKYIVSLDDKDNEIIIGLSRLQTAYDVQDIDDILTLDKVINQIDSMLKTTTQKRILRQLILSNGKINYSTIAKKVHVTDKTVKKAIDDIRQLIGDEKGLKKLFT